MNRRGFIKESGILVCGSVVGGLVFEGCATSSATVIASRRGSELVFPLSQMDGKTYVVVNEPSLEFPVYVTSQEGVYHAVQLKCSHKGCELEPGRRVLSCPCHGSTFKSTGEVLSLPATTPLVTFPVVVRGDVVIIRIS
jgi:Rieske Fe-S protein